MQTLFNPSEHLSEQSNAAHTSSAEPANQTVHPTQVQLTGRLLNFLRLKLQGDDVDELLAKLAAKLSSAPHAPSLMPVVVSAQQPLDLAKLWQGLWQLGLQPIGVITGVLDDQAQAQHIPIFPADGERLDRAARRSSLPPSADPEPNPPTTQSTSQPTTSEQNTAVSPTPAPTQPQAEPTPSYPTALADERLGDRVHTQMLRSGQSINHVGGDLILTQGINAGAEAITDDSLHVYGKAEGRLVAGATGDKNAKIFCLRFNPSLVSVAGTYCLKEQIPAELINRAVQVSFDEEQGLVFSLMDS